MNILQNQFLFSFLFWEISFERFSQKINSKKCVNYDHFEKSLFVVFGKYIITLRSR